MLHAICCTLKIKRGIYEPTRCIIVDVDGDEIFPGIIAKTPKISKPHINKHGLAEEDENFDVKITLDDGTIIMGYECWWQPEKETEGEKS